MERMIVASLFTGLFFPLPVRKFLSACAVQWIAAKRPMVSAAKEENDPPFQWQCSKNFVHPRTRNRLYICTTSSACVVG